MSYLLNNKEWIFSGIGVFILTILFSIWRRKKESAKIPNKKYQSIQNSPIQDSVINNIAADHVELHQTVQKNEINQRTSDQKDDPAIKVHGYPDLDRAKSQYLNTKKRRRAAIYQAIIRRTKEYPDQALEVRHVLDDTEDQINAKTADVVKELEEMSEEGIIRFLFHKDDTVIGPYARIEVTKRFYSSIKSAME
jgi:FtsZ-interacting cell division protein ZipA